MRQLMQPEGIATSTEDADTLTGKALVATLDAPPLGNGVTLGAGPAGVAPAGEIHAMKIAKLTKIGTSIGKTLFNRETICKLIAKP